MLSLFRFYAKRNWTRISKYALSQMFGKTTASCDKVRVTVASPDCDNGVWEIETRVTKSNARQHYIRKTI
jgi:hypothetical protein